MIRWLTRLWRRYLDRPDPAWRPTGLKFTTARHYDYALAQAGARRARRRSETGRTYSKPKPKHASRGNVTPFTGKVAK